MTNRGDAAVGIIANPAAGKDIRRLVSAASPVSDMAKIGIVRRAAIGAVEGGARRLVLADDRHALARRAVAEIVEGRNRVRTVDGDDIEVEVLDLPMLSSGWDSQRAAEAMAGYDGGSEVGAVIVLGGDGTHRDVAKGWRRVPMVALSTGTNNVFPRSMEATSAGHAAGLVASGAVALSDVTDQASVIDVEVVVADGSVTGRDLGLVDVALTSARFTGSRAVWDVTSLREIVTVIAEPDAVGLSAVAAALAPTGRREGVGVHVTLARCAPGSTTIRCAIAPGRYADVAVADHRRLEPGRTVILTGPGVLSFDGERDVVLQSGETARVTVNRDGPRVIDVARAMAGRPVGGGQRSGTMGGNEGSVPHGG